MGKGYYYEAARDRWHAQLRIGGKIKNLGRFKSEEGAQAAVDTALKDAVCGCRCKRPKGNCGCCDEALLDWYADMDDESAKPLD